jgi:hypothetical protein
MLEALCSSIEGGLSKTTRGWATSRKIWKSVHCECKNKSDALKLSSCTSALRQIAFCTNKNKNCFSRTILHVAVRRISNKQLLIDFMLKSAKTLFFPVPGSASYLRKAGGKLQGFLSLSIRLRCQVKICWCFHSDSIVLCIRNWGYSRRCLVSHPLIDVREHVFHLRMAQESAAHCSIMSTYDFVSRDQHTEHFNLKFDSRLIKILISRLDKLIIFGFWHFVGAMIAVVFGQPDRDEKNVRRRIANQPW